MPLEIRELVVRVTVKESQTQQAEAELNKKLQELKAKVVKECMEKILDRMDSLNAR
ncbi:DUF5908 family protein [Sediminibacterium ginsengisoli]|uniref:Uncharacterized protein n=1 Tax=Sediminibacterium ginsengisoli TaxID=413434 RepID=A0A1T4PNS4_9BACT|nr:DUF5908 family protein [Sediminibacterium ginsengisoli]SJZ92558.1 hypothetical protein SAMN04488132_10689 [Sediminibacterium ginsengisoli]